MRRTTGVGPFREQAGADVSMGRTSPAGEMLDVSGGVRLRDVVVTPRKRRRALAAIVLLGSLGLFMAGGQLIARSFELVGLAAATLAIVMAAAGVVTAGQVLFGRERVVIQADTLSWKHGLRSLWFERRLQLSAIQGISIDPPERPWILDPVGPGSAVEISLVQVGGHAKRPWRIAAGLHWTPEELDWMAEYLETGIALARSSSRAARSD
jgi:hypothetical protein